MNSLRNSTSVPALSGWWQNESVNKDIQSILSYAQSEKNLLPLYAHLRGKQYPLLSLGNTTQDFLLMYPSTNEFLSECNEVFSQLWVKATYIFPNKDFQWKEVWITLETLERLLDWESKALEMISYIVFVDYTSWNKKTHTSVMEKLRNTGISLIHHSSSIEYMRRPFGQVISDQVDINWLSNTRNIQKNIVSVEEGRGMEESLIDAMLLNQEGRKKWFLYCNTSSDRQRIMSKISQSKIDSECEVLFFTNDDIRTKNLEGDNVDGIVFFWKFSLHNSTKGLMAAFTSISKIDPIVIDVSQREVWRKDYLTYGIDDLGLSMFSPIPDVDSTHLDLWGKDIANRTENQIPDTVTIGSVFERLDGENLDTESDTLLLEAAKQRLSWFWKTWFQAVDFLHMSGKTRFTWIRENVPSFEKILERRGIMNMQSLSNIELAEVISHHLELKTFSEQEHIKLLKDFLSQQWYTDYWNCVSIPVRDFFSIQCSSLKFFVSQPFKQCSIEDQQKVLKRVFWKEASEKKKQEIREKIQFDLSVSSYIDLLLFWNKIHGKNLSELTTTILSVSYAHGFLLSEWIKKPAHIASHDIARVGEILWLCTSSNSAVEFHKKSIWVKAQEELVTVFWDKKQRLQFYTDFLTLQQSNISRNISSMPFLSLYLKLFIYGEWDNINGRNKFSNDVKIRLFNSMFPKEVFSTQGNNIESRRFADPAKYISCILRDTWHKNLDSLIWGLEQSWKDIIEKSQKLQQLASATGYISAWKKQYTPESLNRLITLLRDNFSDLT